MGFDTMTKKPRKARNNYRRRGKLHMYDGFPHFTTLYDPAHCMCLQECCQSWDDGCICLTCPCRTGKPHGEHTSKGADECL